jgi:hypothetical protein
MPKEQALAVINQLKQDRFQWTVGIRGSVNNIIVECIRASMYKSMKDPFAYFYVMPKTHKEGLMCSNLGMFLQTVEASHIH